MLDILTLIALTVCAACLAHYILTAILAAPPSSERVAKLPLHMNGLLLTPERVTTSDNYILTLHHVSLAQQKSTKQEPNASSLPPCSETDKTQDTSERPRSDNSDGNSKKPVVLLWHGFMMSSTVWTCLPEHSGKRHAASSRSSSSSDSLVHSLLRQGYDVWLGNTRGNKFSCAHTTFEPSDEAFWNFTLDECSQIDLPECIDFILKRTGDPSLSYVGFSQGSTIMFAALSNVRRLDSLVNAFIALAPSTKPKGLTNELVGMTLASSSTFLSAFFGRRALLSSALFWQAIIPLRLFPHCIDLFCYLLFSWRGRYMNDKVFPYQHLYSCTSVKLVAHWFQIMREQKFAPFHDAMWWDRRVSPWTYIFKWLFPSSEQHKMTSVNKSAEKGEGDDPHAPYPLRNIVVPTFVFYGGEDTLPDIPHTLYHLSHAPHPVAHSVASSDADAAPLPTPVASHPSLLPSPVMTPDLSKQLVTPTALSPLKTLVQVKEYEHLHFLWGQGRREVVVEPILFLLSALREEREKQGTQASFTSITFNELLSSLKKTTGRWNGADSASPINPTPSTPPLSRESSAPSDASSLEEEPTPLQNGTLTVSRFDALHSALSTSWSANQSIPTAKPGTPADSCTRKQNGNVHEKKNGMLPGFKIAPCEWTGVRLSVDDGAYGPELFTLAYEPVDSLEILQKCPEE